MSFTGNKYDLLQNITFTFDNLIEVRDRQWPLNTNELIEQTVITRSNLGPPWKKNVAPLYFTMN